jgi:NADP-dependent 3-hydroxy acid dehydrogenase YdfG
VGDRWVSPTSAVYSATKHAVRALSDGLRQEASPGIRVSVIAPGAVELELPNTILDPAMQGAMKQFRTHIIPTDAIAGAIVYTVEQPADMDVNEVVRPIGQKSFYP